MSTWCSATANQPTPPDLAELLNRAPESGSAQTEPKHLYLSVWLLATILLNKNIHTGVGSRCVLAPWKNAGMSASQCDSRVPEAFRNGAWERYGASSAAPSERKGTMCMSICGKRQRNQ
jgi:hypothetical protein